jgi:ribonuclease HI
VPVAATWHDAAVDQQELFGESVSAPEPADGVSTDEPPLVVATDGSCLRNPGPGGWCWYVDDTCWAAGGEADTTNNRMELMAVAELLDALPPGRRVHIQADSSYVVDALTKWRHGWKRRNWRTAGGTPVKNRDLMERLDLLVDAWAPTFEWVRGHDGHDANEAADVRARAAATAVAQGGQVDTGPGLRA